MKVFIESTGSKGNCAVIDDVLIIDAGWNVRPNGLAVFLTHHHSDHIKYLDKMAGLPTYALPETIEKLQAMPRFAYTPFTPVTVGRSTVIRSGEITYYVSPVAVKHDAPCVAYDIAKVCAEVGTMERIFFGTDFSKIVDEKAFIKHLADKTYDALYIEANNTLDPTNFIDVFFHEDKPPKDSFHRERSYNNHTNVDYLIWLFREAGYSEWLKFSEPVTLLHKSSYYYPQNPERVVELCKMVNIRNPIN
jgi:hypothetical protein